MKPKSSWLGFHPTAAETPVLFDQVFISVSSIIYLFTALYVISELLIYRTQYAIPKL